MCNVNVAPDHTPAGAGYEGPRSAVLRVREVEPAARVPLRALVAVGRDATGVLEEPRDVQQVPGQERRVAVGEVVLRSARSGIEVGRPGAGLAEPRAVGLWRGRVARGLRRGEGVYRAGVRPRPPARGGAGA